MKAVIMTKPGGVEVLEYREIADPVMTSPTQVKVAMKAAGINPIDTKIRGRGLFFPDALPAVLGCDGAGIVEDVGSAVTKFRKGDRVWFCHGGLGREQGSYAQLVVIEQNQLAHMPKHANFDIAAAAPLVVITAWEALFDRAKLQAGETVLIHAGAGGVGHVAIQFAIQHGARVATTVSSREKADYVSTLGVENVINYKESNIVDEVNGWTSGKGVDVVFDTVGGKVFADCFNYCTEYGRVVTLLEPPADMNWKVARTKNISFSFELMLLPMLRELPQARAHQLEILDIAARMIDAGNLHLKIQNRFALQGAANAHAMIEAGHTHGKLILEIV